jgi:TonB family protein
VVWLLRRDLRTIHEYEADASVLSSGSDVSQYIQLLMRKAMGTKACTLANGINNSVLKKRVTMIIKPKSNRWQCLRIAYLLPLIAVSLYASCETKTDYQTKEESALILKVKDGKDCLAVKVPVGAFYSWIVNGKLAERGIVEEDGNWNVYTPLPIDEYVFTLDGKNISKDDVPYVPLSSIKELKFIQGEQPRRIELYTNYVSGFQRDKVAQWPEEYKEKTKAWMFFRVEDAATGRQLKGAEVTIEGTDQKALTNNEGWCELKVPLGATVKVSYKGLESQTEEIKHLSGNQVQGRTFWLYKPGHPIYHDYQLSQKEEPVFPGDKEKWIAEHIQLSEAMKNKGVLGRVIVWFVVNEDGSVSGARLRQGINKELNDEALRVVSSMPRWKPAKKDGKPVKYLTTVSVSFKS